MQGLQPLSSSHHLTSLIISSLSSHTIPPMDLGSPWILKVLPSNINAAVTSDHLVSGTFVFVIPFTLGNSLRALFWLPKCVNAILYLIYTGSLSCQLIFDCDSLFPSLRQNSVYIRLVKIFTLHIQMIRFPSDRALCGISSCTYYAAETDD